MQTQENCPYCGNPVKTGASQCVACKKNLDEPKQLPSSTPFRLDTSHLYDEVKAFVLQQDEIGAPQIQRQFQVEWDQAIQLLTRLQSEGILYKPSGSNIYEVRNHPSSSITPSSPDETWRQWKDNYLYAQVKDFVLGRSTVTPYLIRHQFDLTENQAEALLKQLEREGIVSAAIGAQPRTVNLHRKRPPAPPPTALPQAPPSSSPKQPTSSARPDRSSSPSTSSYASTSSVSKSSSHNPTSQGGSATLAATQANASGCDSALGGCGCIGFLLLVILIAFPTVFISDKSQSTSATPSSSTQSSSRRKPLLDVINDPWDGSVYQVKKYLKYSLNDASSVEYVSWGKVTELRDSPYRYLVRCRYRAKNGFGAYMMQDQIFYLNNDGDVVHVTNWE